MSHASQFHIERIKNISADFTNSFIKQLNTVLDEGTVWDNEQGEKFLASDDNALFVAYEGSTIAGFVSAHRLQRFDQRKAEVLLYEIGVNEEFRRKGIGKALIETVKKWAKQVEADEVWVLTNRSNSAGMALYTSTGGFVENADEQMFTYKIS